MEIEVLNKKNNYYELYHVYEDKALSADFDHIAGELLRAGKAQFTQGRQQRLHHIAPQRCV